MNAEQARGALLGLAVGDALGTTYEFEAIAQPDYPTLATGPATDVVGGGPFGLLAGQVTDDTQMAVCLARSLVERGGTLDVDDVARRYVAWMGGAFDIGNQTIDALSRIKEGEPATQAGKSTWIASGRRAAGNGSLMRIAPLAVAYGKRGDDAAMARAAVDESLITHADPRCALACAGFVAAMTGNDHAGARSAGHDRVARARGGIEAGRAYLARAWPDEVAAIDQAVADLASDLDAALAPSPDVYGTLHLHAAAGFVRIAFRLALWHVHHTASWRDAVVDVASRGGDADTNAAIVGALLGARDGAGAIPQAWIERVLAVDQPGKAAWAEAHHPRHLLALV